MLGHRVALVGAELQVFVEQRLHFCVGLAFVNGVAESLLCLADSGENFALLLYGLIVHGPESLGFLDRERELLGDVSHLFSFKTFVVYALLELLRVLRLLGHSAE